MKRLLYLSICIVVASQSAVSAVTTSERKFMKACVELGCQPREARTLCDRAAKKFEQIIYRSLFHEWMSEQQVKTPITAEMLLQTVLQIIPFQLNQAAIDCFQLKVETCLAAFYKGNPLPWIMSGREHKTKYGVLKVPMQGLKMRLGILEALALDCVRIWLCNEFLLIAAMGRNGRRVETVEYDKDRFSASIEKYLLQPRGQVVCHIDDEAAWLLVDEQQERHHSSFSDAPEGFFDGDDMSDEKKDNGMKDE